jgi:hypothetical protein
MTVMATASQRRSPSPVKRSARPASRPPAKPFLRFYHSEELRRKTLAVLDVLERARDATAHRNALADVVVELTSSGMDYYFMKPLRLANVGFIVQQSASLGLVGVQQVLAPVIRNMIGRMDGAQLLSVRDSIRQLML